MAGAGSAGAAGAGYVKMICDKLTQAVAEIVNSSHFDKKEILQRSLNLTQAYCLLWQDSKDGKVDGKMELTGGAVCAAVVDLIVLDKVEIEIDPKSCLGIKYENTLLKVKMIILLIYKHVNGAATRDRMGGIILELVLTIGALV